MQFASEERIANIERKLAYLPAFEGFELIAQYCLSRPDIITSTFAKRTLGLAMVAVALEDAVYSDEPSQIITSIRVFNEDNPFANNSGVELKLPNTEDLVAGNIAPRLLASGTGGFSWTDDLKEIGDSARGIPMNYVARILEESGLCVIPELAKILADPGRFGVAKADTVVV